MLYLILHYALYIQVLYTVLCTLYSTVWIVVRSLCRRIVCQHFVVHLHILDNMFILLVLHIHNVIKF